MFPEIDVAVTVTPCTARLSGPVTLPRMTSVVWAARSPPASDAATTAIRDSRRRAFTASPLEWHNTLVGAQRPSRARTRVRCGPRVKGFLCDRRVQNHFILSQTPGEPGERQHDSHVEHRPPGWDVSPELEVDGAGDKDSDDAQHQRVHHRVRRSKARREIAADQAI